MEMSSIESENGVRTILDKATEIRERDMSNWEPYVRTKIITQQEATLVSSFDKNKLGRKEQIEKDGVATVRSLLKILAGISKADVLQYSITLLDDLLEEDETRVNLLLQAGQTSDSASWVPFMRILEKREDAYLMMQAARMIGRVVAAGEKLQGREFKFFTQWLRDTIMRKASDSLDLALAVAIKILQRPDNRVPFMNDGLAAILGCINNSESKVQSQYMAVMCLWLLSFDETVAARLGIDEPRLISDVAHVLRSARKEKLARVCVALFKNLLSKPTETSILSKYKTMMVGQKLMPLIDTFVNQKPFNDEELIEDSQFIAGKLHECFEQMSTFDEYASEVKSGELEWSPVHKSARFWKDNVLRLNDNNYELLRLLVQIMESSDNKEHLAIAAHDIGEYVRYNPRGKSVIDSLDGKTQIMKLMLHADMSVKYEALLALQKIMTNNWEYLGEKVKEAVEN